MTLALDEHGRPEPSLDDNEWETLTGFLDYQRATFAWKSANLTPAQLSQRLPPSSMTMGGLMKHRAYVEDDWFGRWLQDEPLRKLFYGTALAVCIGVVLAMRHIRYNN